VGPELGVEADWYMGCKWSMYGSFDVVLYYGHTKTNIHNTDTFTSTVSVSNGTNRHSSMRLAQMLHSVFAGIKLGK
jgi:hypothetical protein